jgi:DMSO/TMAO reductase YedYZ heme-binding membrane subunit
LRLFNYYFYRIAKAYYKWDGKEAATAVVGLSLLQFFLLTAVIIPVSRLFFSRVETAPYAKDLGLLAAGFIILLSLYNSYKYRDQYAVLQVQWRAETATQRRFRGAMVVLAIPFAMLLLLVLLWAVSKRNS